MSKITEITEFENENIVPMKNEYDWQKYDGWKVVTEDQTVIVGIDNGQSCCEDWGYLSTDDNPQRFVGANLLQVERVSEDETDLLIASHPDTKYGLDCGEAVFVNIVTDQGTFQLAVYNSHNGYYGHDAVVISRDLNLSETL